MNTAEKKTSDESFEETDVRKTGEWNLSVILGNIVSVLVSWAAAYAVMIFSEGFLYDKSTDEGISYIICIVAFVLFFVICLRISRSIICR